jgi:general secretion pathway protein C
MDWSRYFHLSVSDFQGFVSRRTVILAVMAVVLYQGAGIFYDIVKLQMIGSRPAPAAEAKAKEQAVAVREALDGYRVIPERNLFGTTTKTIAEKQPVAPPQIDVLTLFELRGTVAGDGKTGFAIVEEKATRKQRMVKVGDVLSGAKVVRVRRNALDLLSDDQERTLKMAETREAPIVPPSAAASVAAAPASRSGGIVVNRADIEADLRDMGSMMRQAQVRPYFNAGVPDGFMISNIQPASVYQKMGITDGDIVQGVNNQPIKTADDFMRLINTLRTAEGLSLTVKRRGNQETLSYQFR